MPELIFNKLTLVQKRCVLQKAVALLFTLMLFPGWSGAQSISGKKAMVHYSIENGLPSAEVYDIIQDQKGYLWIATDKGVCRFDGTNFITFTTKDGLSDNSVLRLSEDTKGRIWFVGYNRTLSYFYKDSIYQHRFNDAILEATQKYLVFIITDLKVNANDSIVALATTGEIASINSKGETVPHERFTEESKLLNTWNEKEVKLIREGFPYLDLTDSLLLTVGAYTYTKSRGSLRIFEDENTYVLTSPHGAVRVSSRPKTVKPILEKEFVTSYCRDIEGGEWYTTLSNGIFYIPNPDVLTYDLTNTSQVNKDVSFVFQDTSLIAFLTASNAFKYDEGKGIFEKIKQPISYFKIPEKYRAEEGLKFEYKLEMELLPPDQKSLLAYNQTMGLFVSKEVYDTLLLLSMSSSLFLSARIEGNYLHSYDYIRNYAKVLKIVQTADGQVWLGTILGLYKYKLPEKEPVELLKEDPVFNSRIEDMVETKDGLLVLATRGRGVFLWNRDTDSILQITEEHGLLSNTINRLLYDAESDVIWVATSGGLNRLSHKGSGRYEPQDILDRSDGLNAVDIRQIALYKNFLFAGSGNRVIQVSIDKTNDRYQSPLLYLDEIRVGKSRYNPGDFVQLSYDNNDLSFQYQGISYASRGDIRYRYMMDGVDDEWLETRETKINYGSVPPGNYMLRIKAVNTQGVESAEENIFIKIKPPFWQTWWFSGILILLGALVIYLVVRAIINRYKYQAEMEHRINELRSLSLRARMNPHFIFNSLNSVQNYILKNKKEEANEFLIIFSRLIRLVLQNSDSLETVFEKEIEMIRLYVDLEKKRVRNDFKYTENIDPDLPRKKCLVPSLMIQPFVENAIWHGNIHKRVDGEIQLNVKREGVQLKVEIVDNGIGRKASKRKRMNDHSSYATAITRKRISLLAEGDVSSEIRIEDAYPGNDYVGTRVVFTIPYKTTG